MSKQVDPLVYRYGELELTACFCMPAMMAVVFQPGGFTRWSFVHAQYHGPVAFSCDVSRDQVVSFKKERILDDGDSVVKSCQGLEYGRVVPGDQRNRQREMYNQPLGKRLEEFFPTAYG